MATKICSNCKHADIFHNFPTKPNGLCVVMGCDCQEFK